MKIRVKKVVKPLSLRDFDEAYGSDERLDVWANPPRRLKARWTEIRLENDRALSRLKEASEQNGAISEEERAALAGEIEAASEGIYEWLSEVWSQGEDESRHISPEGVREIAVHLQEEDPALWIFLIGETWRIINDHRAGSKKDLRERS